MEHFKYMCYVCYTEDTYEEGDNYCSNCGTKINHNMRNMERDIDLCDEKISRFKEETKVIFDNYNDDVLKNLLFKDEYYKNFCNIITLNEQRDISEVKAETEKNNKQIDKIIKKMKSEDREGFEVLILDTVFRYTSKSSVKRLFPQDTEAKPVSPEHLYNAYMCNKNRSKCIGIDGLSDLYLFYKNNTYIETQKKDTDSLHLTCCREYVSENDQIKVLPMINMLPHDYDSCRDFFEYTYSKENTAKSREHYMIKNSCIMKEEEGTKSIASKGEIVFISMGEYDKMLKYYNEIIADLSSLKSEDLFDFDYYGLLNNLYNSYTAETKNVL
ncbi:MAG: hypothetical protein LUC97_09780 [Clostridiales bacterium]|nr:hypothetical protein [Clostridiales bacterium]